MSVYSTREAFGIYTYYLAVKNHFTKPSYDYFKYNGKTSTSVQAFETKKDKFYYYKLSKNKDAKDLILSNLLQDPRKWVGEIVDNDKSTEIYNEWKKKMQSLSYHFKNELGCLNENFDSNLLVENGQHPHLLKLYNRKVVSLETLVIIADLTKCLTYWDTKITDPVVYPDINMKCRKYRPFLNYDREKMRTILLDTFDS